MRDRKLVDYYNKRASEYEQIYYRPIAKRRQELLDEGVRLQKLVGGRDVLELACGTGYWTHLMSETAAHVTASDISAEMLNEARQKPFAKPVDFLRADLFGLPFRPESFDCLAIGFWFSHHPRQDYARFFEMITRPLRTGSPIWMIDNNPPAEGPTNDSAGTDEHGNNLKVRKLGNGQEHVILKNYFVKDELESIFAPRFPDRSVSFYGEYYWAVEMRANL